jgi:zinc protease
MKKIINFLLVFYYLFCFSVVALEYNSNTILQMDPEIATGQLDNGLTYYVYENEEPEDVAYLRLVIKAGSLQEDEDQQGLAHFVEHMAFNGSLNFDSGEIINFLESIGMEYGAHLNASTGYDKTIYKLKIPTDDQKIIKKSILVLADFAGKVSFKEQAFENERKVVVEEWRASLGSTERQREKLIKINFANSKYAVRKPIGKVDLIKTFEPQRARDFYYEWYRPELMAVIAIGDFEKENIVSLINEHFSSLTNPTQGRPREVYSVPLTTKDSVYFVTDTEETTTLVRVLFNHKTKLFRTQGDFRDNVVLGIYLDLLNQRLSEIALQKDPPFVAAGIYEDQLTPKNTQYTLAFIPLNNDFERGFEAMLTEIERVRQHGFLNSELERIKDDYLSYYQKIYDNRDDQDSTFFLQDFVDRFVNKEAITSIVFDYELIKAILLTITIEDLKTITDKWFLDAGRKIVITAPEKNIDSLPAPDDLLALLNQSSQNQLAVYEEDDVVQRPLLEVSPVPSKIIYEKYHKQLDTTEWHLANGVRVILKPTDFKKNSVRFSAQSPGGTSLVSDEFFVSADKAIDVVIYSGVGSFNTIELNKKLSGKNLSIEPKIFSLSEGMSGSSTTEDLSTLFELIYLYFTAPRFDDDDFENYKKREREMLLDRQLDPEEVFSDLYISKLYNNHYRVRPWTLELLEEVDYEQAFQFYQERFDNAGDFTFYFVGSFDLKMIKPLVERYLGGLPSTFKRENWKDRNVDYFRGIHSDTLKMGLEPKSTTYLIYTGPFAYNIRNRLNFYAMQKMLNIRLNETVREKIGGVYSIGAYGSKAKYPNQSYAFIIYFNSDPERQEEIIEVIEQEIENLQEKGFGQSYLDKVNKQMLQEYREEYKTNDFWLSTFQFYDWIKEPYLNIYRVEQLHQQRTLKEIVNLARKTFLKRNYMFLTHLPE